MKILCICPIGIGNYLLVYPACCYVRTAFPHAELHLLALRRPIAEFAGRDELWNKVHAIDPTKERSARAGWQFVRTLARERYDASLSLFPSNTWQYNLLPFLGGVRKRFAFDYVQKKKLCLSFLNNRLLPVDPALHDVEQNLRMAAAFSGGQVPADAAEPVFPRLFSAAEEREAASLLDELGEPGRFIGIHAGSSGEHGMDAKRWDPLRFGELGKRMCEKLGARALIFGGPDEENIKRTVASVIGAPHRIMDVCSLPLTAALISRCTAFLCNDSGLMHMAAAVRVPVAAVFGPTDERRNGPMGKGHCIIRKPMEGFPLWTAGNAGVRTVRPGIDVRASLNALSVADAWETVLPWLESAVKAG